MLCAEIELNIGGLKARMTQQLHLHKVLLKYTLIEHLFEHNHILIDLPGHIS